jgi:hypothetical protein
MGGVADGGNAAMPEVAARGSSEALLGPHVGIDEAASRLGLKVRATRYLIGKRLVAVLVGGRWLIDETSLAAEVERRREQAL